MKTWRILLASMCWYMTGFSPSTSTVTLGSLLHMPMQPEFIMRISCLSVSAICSRRASITSLAPAAIPQVPMWTVILTFAPPSRRDVPFLTFSFIFLRSSIVSLAMLFPPATSSAFCSAQKGIPLLRILRSLARYPTFFPEMIQMAPWVLAIPKDFIHRALFRQGTPESSGR